MTQCYMCDPMSSNSMKSANPHSGFHAISVWPCLDTSTQNANKSQGGGHRVVYAMDGDKWKVRPSGNYQRAGGNGFGINEDGASYTLNTVDRHIVAILTQEKQ